MNLNLFPTLNCLTGLKDAARSLSVERNSHCSLMRTSYWSKGVIREFLVWQNQFSLVSRSEVARAPRLL